jgi:hypothetical protein
MSFFELGLVVVAEVAARVEGRLRRLLPLARLVERELAAELRVPLFEPGDRLVQGAELFLAVGRALGLDEGAPRKAHALVDLLDERPIAGEEVAAFVVRDRLGPQRGLRHRTRVRHVPVGHAAPRRQFLVELDRRSLGRRPRREAIRHVV